MTKTPAFAGVVGEDDRTIITKDPDAREAKLANRIGSVFFNQTEFGRLVTRNAGTAQLIMWENGLTYMILSAHGLFHENSLPRFNTEATFQWSPNTQYYHGDQPEIDDIALKDYLFEPELLNSDAKLWKITDLDIAILRIDQGLADEPVFGHSRGASRLASVPIEVFFNASSTDRSEIILISEHKDFFDGTEVSYQDNCRIAPRRGVGGRTWLHNCDIETGSSGAGLYVWDESISDFVLIGVNTASPGKYRVTSDQEFEERTEGNIFVPASRIREAFKRLEHSGKIPSSH